MDISFCYKYRPKLNFNLALQIDHAFENFQSSTNHALEQIHRGHVEEGGTKEE